MAIFETIFSKLTIRDIGFHLTNYANLYIRPLNVWKKVIGNRKYNSDFIVLHLIYYCLFISFLISDVKLAIPLTILEATLTVFPLSIFILPFIFYSVVYKTQYTWDQLFKLFLILKFQFSPILVLLMLLGYKLKIENIIVITDNLIFLLWIAFIVVFPVIVSISFWKKFIWVITNYIFFILGMWCWSSVMQYVDSEGKLTTTVFSNDPSFEFDNFSMQTQFLSEIFDDSHYFILLEKKNNRYLICNTHFVSPELLESFKKLETIRDENVINSNVFLSILNRTKPLTLPMLESFRINLNLEFDSLLSKVRRLEDSTKWQSNKEYFKAYANYLNAYQKSYSNQEVDSVLKDNNLFGLVRFDSSHFGVIFNVDSNYYATTKNELKHIETNLEKRSERSMFLINIIFSPVNLF